MSGKRINTKATDKPKRIRKRPAAGSANGHAPPTNGHAANGQAAAPAAAPLVSVADVPDEELDCLWAGRCARGEVTLVSGEAGLGKSMLTAELAAAVSVGRPLPGGPLLEPAGVLYFSSEDSMGGVVKHRLSAAGACLARVRTLSPSTAERAGPGALLQLLEGGTVFQLRPLPALLILDCISDFLPTGANPNAETDVRPYLQRLRAIARRYELAVWAIRHPRKSRAGSDLANVAGAAAWTQVPRHALEVRERPGQEWDRLLVCTKSSNSEKARPLRFRIEKAGRAAKVVFGGELDRPADELSDEDTSASGRSALAYTMAVLRDLLDDGEKPAADVRKAMEQANCSRGTTDRAVVRLGVERFKQPGISNGPWLWKKPDAGWKE
jgi:hypothetical protein